MPTQLDRVLENKAAILGFAGIVAAVAAYSIWGSDLFPAEKEPTGSPDTWTETEMQRWLRKRGMLESGKETREEMIARIQSNLHAP